mmetsp:Transcript_4818/g.6826  ORF Transcript_4818/g.6826 Transcript_4818/m.6826 type:complete len:247 (+) Transcript_4818:36-776(+)
MGAHHTSSRSASPSVLASLGSASFACVAVTVAAARRWQQQQRRHSQDRPAVAAASLLLPAWSSALGSRHLVPVSRSASSAEAVSRNLLLLTVEAASKSSRCLSENGLPIVLPGAAEGFSLLREATAGRPLLSKEEGGSAEGRALGDARCLEPALLSGPSVPARPPSLGTLKPPSEWLSGAVDCSSSKLKSSSSFKTCSAAAACAAEAARRNRRATRRSSGYSKFARSLRRACIFASNQVRPTRYSP